MSPIQRSESPKRPRRLKTPIEPIHVEELLAGAGMSGFLGVVERPGLPAPSEIPARVLSVVRKVEALTEIMEAHSEKSRQWDNKA